MPSLLVITDRTVSPDLMAGVSAALEGGVTHILLREKTMAAGPLAVLAQKLRTVTAAMGAHLLIHDRVDIALAMEADGVHLPESGPFRKATPDCCHAVRGTQGIQRSQRTGDQS